MIKKKVINNPILLGVGMVQYLRVSRRCPHLDQDPIFLLEIGPIPFLGLDLIDPRSSFILFTSKFFNFVRFRGHLSHEMKHHK